MQARSTRPSLLQRVRDPADRNAWDDFVTQYGDLITRYAAARGLQRCDAEDIRQIVFAKLFRTLRTFDYAPQRGRFRDYLGTAVRNAVCEWRQRPDRAAAAVDTDVLAQVPDPSPADADADPTWEREWMDHHYRRALAALRETFEPRSVAVFLRLLDGQTLEEVAIAESMNNEAVRKVRLRVRDRMSELVAEQVREEDAE